MPQIHEFDPGHTDGISRADLLEGEQVPKELIYECQRSVDGIEHAGVGKGERNGRMG